MKSDRHYASLVKGLLDTRLYVFLSSLEQAARNPSAEEIVYPIPDGDQALNRVSL